MQLPEKIQGNPCIFQIVVIAHQSEAFFRVVTLALTILSTDFLFRTDANERTRTQKYRIVFRKYY
jgi:hypothetical protein